VDRHRERHRAAVKDTFDVTLDRETVLAGIRDEVERFTALIESLGDEELRVPTRCAGWTIAHVAGHVVGTIVDVSQGRVEGQGTPAVTTEQASARVERTAAELATELATAAPALFDLLDSLPAEAWDGPSLTDPTYTLGFAVEAIWFDAYLHADDIRTAVGRASERGDGLVAAVHHVAGYLDYRGVAVTLELDGVETIPVGRSGVIAKGDPLAFVLAATGRIDPTQLGLDPAINVYRD
jgi:uncharacterized protein (TIGR03083 family)